MKIPKFEIKDAYLVRGEEQYPLIETNIKTVIELIREKRKFILIKEDGNYRYAIIDKDVDNIVSVRLPCDRHMCADCKIDCRKDADSKKYIWNYPFILSGFQGFNLGPQMIGVSECQIFKRFEPAREMSPQNKNDLRRSLADWVNDDGRSNYARVSFNKKYYIKN